MFRGMRPEAEKRDAVRRVALPILRQVSSSGGVYRAIGIEREDTEKEPYCRIAQKRTEAAKGPERTLFDA